MDIDPNELVRFERIALAGGAWPRRTELTRPEIVETIALFDARGVRTTCLLCDANIWHWAFWRGNGGHGLTLARTCERCAHIQLFDAARLYPADPIRARAEAWAPELAPQWERAGASREDLLKSLIGYAVWDFDSPAQWQRFNAWSIARFHA